MNTQPADLDATLAASLQRQQAVCWDIMKLVQDENSALAAGAARDHDQLSAARKNLLTRLNDSLNSIRTQRALWQRTQSHGPAPASQAHALLKSNLDLIMKIIVLDRENEQLLVRRGLMPPGRLPAQQPHFVTELYRRTTRC